MGLSSAIGPAPSERATGIADDIPKSLDLVLSRLTDIERRQERALHDMHVRLANQARMAQTPPAPAPAPKFTLPASSPDVWLPVNDDDPWDLQSAEALVALYQQAPRETAGPSTSVAALALVAPRVASTAAAAAAPVQAAGLSGSDRSWIEGQLAEIARLVETSRADTVSKAQFDGVATRIDGLEFRLDTALAGVASRADVEALQMLDGRFEDVTQQLADAQSQFQRIDAIETLLTEIADRIDQGGGAAPADLDIEAIVHTAAEQASQRLADMQPAAPVAVAETGRLDELQDLVSGLIDQTHAGKTESDSALETLQEAIIGLIDRLDHLERKAADAVAPAANVQHFRSAAADFEQRDAAPEPQLPPQRFQHVEPKLPEEPPHVADAVAEHPADKPDWATEPLDLPPPPKAAMSRRPMPPDEGPTPAPTISKPAASIMEMRRDFRTEAFRAKQKAISGEAITAEPAPAHIELKSHSSAAPPASIAALRTKIDLSSLKPAETPESAAAPSSGRASPVVIGVAALVAAVGGFLGVTFFMNGQGAPEQAAISAPAEKTTASAKSASSSEPPGLMPDDEPKPRAPRAPAAAAPGKSSAAQDSLIGPLSTPGGDNVVRAPQQIPVGSGIALATNAGQISPEDLMRMRQLRQTPQGELHTQPQTIAVAPAQVPGQMGDSSRPGHAIHLKDLPPASVGPLSLRIAAAKGDPSAEFEVAARLAEGKGIKQDFEQALDWYQRSAARGFAPAQYRLATLFERGLGTKPDIGRARIWYKRAAELGNVKAMHNLAVLSANRESTTPDYPTAAHWFTEAANRGLSDSQFNLGVLFENGLGVAKDEKTAYKWLALAARSGDKESVRRRDLAGQKLAPDDRSQMDYELGLWRGIAVDKAVNDPTVAGNAWRERDQQSGN